MRPTIRHVNGEEREEWKLPRGFSCEAKLLNFLKKKQVNEFFRVKTVIILNFRNEKIIFLVFYVDDVNKSVP